MGGNNTEFDTPSPTPTSEAIPSEQDSRKTESRNLYKEIIQTEAKSLIGKYLPDALPQEPTEMLFGIPFYIGKFQGKHYVTVENFISVSEIDQKIRRLKRTSELQDSDERKQLKEAWDQRSGKWVNQPEMDFSNISVDDVNKLYDEFFQDLSQSYRELNEKEEKIVDEELGGDTEDPERLKKGQSEYTTYTWMAIHTAMHELIHQRQAELQPSAFPELQSPELDNIDPNNIPRNELIALLTEAHKANSRAEKPNSIFHPVIEGMAIIGSYYVMTRLIADLVKDGKMDIANKLLRARRLGIRKDLENSNKPNTEDVYATGSNIIRKLYKTIGIENLVPFIKGVDLKACQEIVEGSDQYDKIIADPTTLPNLH